MHRPEGLSDTLAENVIDVHLARRRGNPSLDRTYCGNASGGVCGNRANPIGDLAHFPGVLGELSGWTQTSYNSV